MVSLMRCLCRDLKIRQRCYGPLLTYSELVPQHDALSHLDTASHRA